MNELKDSVYFRCITLSVANCELTPWYQEWKCLHKAKRLRQNPSPGEAASVEGTCTLLPLWCETRRATILPYSTENVISKNARTNLKERSRKKDRLSVALWT